MPELEWTEPAIADLLAIIEYVSEDNPDAAQALKDDIVAKAAKLPEFPRLYRAGRVEGTGKWSCGPIILSSMMRIRSRFGSCAFFMVPSNGRRKACRTLRVHR